MFNVQLSLFNETQWRRGWDSNPRWSYPHSGFRDRPVQPLQHLPRSQPSILAAKRRKIFCYSVFDQRNEVNMKRTPANFVVLDNDDPIIAANEAIQEKIRYR